MKQQAIRRWCPGRTSGRRLAATLACALACCVSGSIAQAQLTTGLQSYFDFETGTITNVVAGASGYTPTITNTGTPESGFVGSVARPLIAGNALNLIRSETDYFTITNIGSGALTPGGGLNLGGNFTLSAWHYLDPAPASPTANRYFIWEGAADFDVSYGTGGGTSGPDNYSAYTTTVTARTVSLARNTWNNIVQVFSNDGTNITGNLYINGQFIGSDTTLLSNMDWGQLRYGNSRGGGGRAWDGTLDEIGIWNTSLSGAQAQEVYIRGVQGTGLTASTTGVDSWSSAAATDDWTTNSNWTGGSAIGAAGAAAGSSNAVAIFGTYALPTGLGIDMSVGAADGALGVGAIVVDSASGSLRIGNSSPDANGVLWLNGATTGAGANTLLSVSGASDLGIADSPDPLNPGSTTLGVTLGIANGTISIGTGRTATIESVIGEAAAGSGFTKTGSGTLVLTAANTYTGATTVNAGALNIQDAAALGTTAGSTTVASGGALELQGGISVGAEALSIAGTGVSSGGALRNVGGDNTYGGAITQTAASRINSDSGSLALTGGINGAFNLTFGGAGDIVVSNTISTGAGTLTKDGAGTLTLTAANTYTGGTAINAGTLAANAANALGAGNATVASGATLDIGHADAIQAATLTPASGSTVSFTAAAGTYTIGGLAGDGNLVATGKTLAIGGNNASTTYYGNVTADALTKQGTGTLTLTGSNTLTDTRIEGGSVFANSAGAFGSGTVTLAGGGLRVAPGTAITNAIVLDGAAASNVLGSAVELDYLVVGGGGGGAARDSSGGGGGGGVLSSLVSAGLTPILGQAGDTFAVTVGGGGAGALGPDGGGTLRGNVGGSSSFDAISASGGGGGGGYNTTGGNGATGGGGGRNSSGGTGIEGQGFNGGAGTGGTSSAVDAGGGGGGAGALGGNGVPSVSGGNGGVGLAVPIVSTTLAGELGIGQVSGADVYFGGGGGGTPHRNAGFSSGSGGLGGGGAGAANATSLAGVGQPNTGGGGGASRSATAGPLDDGGNGGSGVVVVRYAGDQMFNGGDDVRTEGGFTYHTFKTAGSSTLDYLGGDASVSSTIGGTGGFTWSSAGTLTLSGFNSYQGGTIISAGTLIAANAPALGTGTATVASGARLQLDSGSIIANEIADLGTFSFLGTLDFAGGGLARTSNAGGGTIGNLLAGSAGSPVSLNPDIAWLAQTAETASDILQLTGTAFVPQVLSLTYDSVLSLAAEDAYLGWFDTDTNTWVNAIDGNSGGSGSFFEGSWTDYLTANPGATPTTALGVYGHDTATSTVWAVVNHNSDFTVIAVPEPGTFALAGLGLAGVIALIRRRRVSA